MISTIVVALTMVGNRAVPSDVAALAGVDLAVAKEGLVNLATTVGGDLEVSKDGKQDTKIYWIVPVCDVLSSHLLLNCTRSPVLCPASSIQRVVHRSVYRNTEYLLECTVRYSIHPKYETLLTSCT